MKQVIFVCLLSLSVCLSQQANTPLETATQNATVASQNATITKTNANTQEAAADAVTKPPVLETGAAKQNATASNVTQSKPVSNETSAKTNETKPSEKNNSTAIKPDEQTPKPVDPPKGNNETKPVTPTVPVTNGTNADGKDSKKNETTTPKGENVSPTAAPVEAKTRAFDGPSFIGGIILTLGLLAIGFMGFKYYKNQTERNYHTL